MCPRRFRIFSIIFRASWLDLRPVEFYRRHSRLNSNNGQEFLLLHTEFFSIFDIGKEAICNIKVTIQNFDLGLGLYLYNNNSAREVSFHSQNKGFQIQKLYIFPKNILSRFINKMLIIWR